MIREEGIVKEVKNKNAVVAFLRNEDDCEDTGCKNCKQCETIGSKQYVLLDVENSINAKVNDKVIVESIEVDKISASFLVFILPLVFLIISLILKELANSTFYGIVGGVILFIIWIFYLKNKLKKYKMRIIKIIRNE